VWRSGYSFGTGRKDLVSLDGGRMMRRQVSLGRHPKSAARLAISYGALTDGSENDEVLVDGMSAGVRPRLCPDQPS
jgi:hypothetical protein